MAKLENSFDIDGKVVSIGQPQPFGKLKTRSKRILVLKIQGGRYFDDIPFEFLDSNGDLLNEIAVDDTVLVNFQIGAWKMDREDGTISRYPTLRGRLLQKL